MLVTARSLLIGSISHLGDVSPVFLKPCGFVSKILILQLAVLVVRAEAINVWIADRQTVAGMEGNREGAPRPWYDTSETDAKIEALRSELAAAKSSAIAVVHASTTNAIISSEQTHAATISKEREIARREMVQKINLIRKEAVTREMVKDIKENILEARRDEWKEQLGRRYIQELKENALNELRAEFKMFVLAQKEKKCTK